VKINFDDEKNDSICGQCQMKFSDCPHINQSGTAKLNFKLLDLEHIFQLNWNVANF